MPTPDGIAKYKKLLTDLFPTGFAWNWVREDRLGLIEAMAIEFCRVEERASDLLNREIDPRTADELLTDWETLLGLPDACTPDNLLLDERRALAAQRLSRQGGLSAAYLESLIEILGFDSKVTDYKPFRVGESVVGERLTNDFDRPFRVGENRVGDQLRETGWRYVFQVDLPATAVSPFRVGINTVGEPLVAFGNAVVECEIFKSKQAHTQPFFTFGL